jgi:uncharacterized protein YoxC
MAKAGNAEINRVEHEIRNRIDMVKRTTAECDKKVHGINDEFQGIANKFKMGVPKNDVAALTKMVNEAGQMMAGFKKAIQELDSALLEVVNNNIKDHRPIIDKCNSELGQAKGQIKASLEAINLGLTRDKEMRLILQKVIG